MNEDNQNNNSPKQKRTKYDGVIWGLISFVLIFICYFVRVVSIGVIIIIALGIVMSIQDIKDKNTVGGIMGLIINIVAGIAFIMSFIVPLIIAFISIFIH